MEDYHEDLEGHEVEMRRAFEMSSHRVLLKDYRVRMEAGRQDTNIDVLRANGHFLSEAAKQWHIPLTLKRQAMPPRLSY